VESVGTSAAFWLSVNPERLKLECSHQVRRRIDHLLLTGMRFFCNGNMMNRHLPLTRTADRAAPH
jgi:hypothetical protein